VLNLRFIFLDRQIQIINRSDQTKIKLSKDEIIFL